MAEVVGVRFKEVGKVYYFDPDGHSLKKGDMVIVETARGVECGEVAMENRDVSEEEIVKPLKKLVRVATDEDIDKVKENKKKEKEAFEICEKKILKHGLDMKLVDIEYTFDNSKILFYFTADGRVDFRELVKDLASVFHTRIELRQIGVRDESKMLGGIGICGRLMCCLKYEQNAYDHLLRITPKTGAIVETPEGRGKVVDVNLLRGIVKVQLDKKADAAPAAYDRRDVKVIRDKKIQVEKDELEALKDIE